MNECRVEKETDNRKSVIVCYNDLSVFVYILVNTAAVAIVKQKEKVNTPVSAQEFPISLNE